MFNKTYPHTEQKKKKESGTLAAADLVVDDICGKKKCNRYAY
jgi:hypothetical protein